MLSQAEVVAVRAAIEKSYVGVCSIFYRGEVVDKDRSTGFSDVVAFENIPCKLSFAKIATASASQVTGVNQSGKVFVRPVAKVVQSGKLFLNPEVEVLEGAKITVLQNGKTYYYKSSGCPAVYSTHQEIMVELVSQWA